mmetsp:Transcript_120539/g.352076  ORF Transcript_120539/g.352076 Transcript_120539/m.352076 type:complete len:223 (-) Transcript_120539:1106-1774(-)
MAGRLVGSQAEHASIQGRQSAMSELDTLGHGRWGTAPDCKISRSCCLWRRRENGKTPVRTKNERRLNENTSALLLAGKLGFWTSSGAIHISVPPMRPTCLVRTRARPKSKSFARKELVRLGSHSMTMLFPFKSPWTMAGCRECRWQIAKHTSLIALSWSVSIIGRSGTPPSRMNLSRHGPWTHSRIKRILPSSLLRHEPKNMTMLGWRKRLRIRTSLSNDII